jgi:hypothetical protein
MYISTTTYTTDTISNFSNGGYTYGYIDYSASTPTSIAYIDSTTAPKWNESLKGWYNGDDRCIAAYYCDSAATISLFTFEQLGDICFFLLDELIISASDINPNSALQAPDDLAISAITPVNATHVVGQIAGEDTTDRYICGIVQKEIGDSHDEASIFNISEFTFIGGYAGTTSGTVRASFRLPLGKSRDVYVFGEDNDNNSLSLYIKGYGIRR